MTVTETPSEKPRSLLPVIEVIPDHCYENPTWRGLYYFFRDLVVYAAVVTGLLMTDKIYFLIPLWLVAGMAVSGLFVVGHDAAHQALFKSKRLNGIVGRIAMIPSLHVFEAWVLGHNRVHHGHTIKSGFDFVWHPASPEDYQAMSGGQKLLHKIEWSPVGYGLYYGRQVWWQKMIWFIDPPKRYAASIKSDKRFLGAALLIISAALAVLGFAQYDSVLGSLWLITKVLVIPAALFMYIIGLVVHIHHIDKNIEWHARREWTKYHGQVEGTTIIHAPKWVDFFLHWILEHSPHHVDMRIPMYHLYEAGQAMTAHFPVPERKLRVKDILSNTRACKVFDFDEHRWMTYKEAQSMVLTTDDDVAVRTPDVAGSPAS